MREIRNFVALLSLLLVVLGCGGSGTLTHSPFEGQWAGTWESASLGEDGTVDMTIASNGAMTGAVRDQFGDTASLSGRVNNAGQVSGTVQYPGMQAVSLSGTLTFNQQGRLVGTFRLTARVDGTNYTHDASFNLTRQ